MSSKQLPTVQLPKPPAHVAVFSDLIGVELTIDFLMEFGGARCHIPKRPNNDHEMVLVIGRENVELLANCPDIPDRIPLAKPWLSRCFRARGDKIVNIARKLKTSDGNVAKWTKSP